MTIWLDNHLSPALARWMTSEFGVECVAVRDLGFARSSDREIFEAAAKSADVIISKDRDFAELVSRLGPPPAILLLCCGNTSTQYLRYKLSHQLDAALKLFAAGVSFVEIGGRG